MELEREGSERDWGPEGRGGGCPDLQISPSPDLREGAGGGLWTKGGSGGSRQGSAQPQNEERKGLELKQQQPPFLPPCDLGFASRSPF